MQLRGNSSKGRLRFRIIPPYAYVALLSHLLRSYLERCQMWEAGNVEHLDEFSMRRKQLHQANVKHFHSHSVPLDMSDISQELDAPISQCSLNSKVSVLLRVGMLDLASGTGAFRVEEMLEKLGAAMGIYVRASVTFTTIEASFSDGNERSTEVIDLPLVGVNTERIWFMEHFADWVAQSMGKEPIFHKKHTKVTMQLVDALTPFIPKGSTKRPVPVKPGEEPTLRQVHDKLNSIEYHKKHYSIWMTAFATAIACASFSLLMGGRLFDVIAAFIGAGIGQFVRSKLLGRFVNHFFVTGITAALAGIIAIGVLRLIGIFDPTALQHDAAYIGAMLFVVPGFPLITGFLDIVKLDLLSGMQRLAYASAIMMMATLAAWGVAQVVDLRPEGFGPSPLDPLSLTAMRVLASFAGVWGFSILFNSPGRMAVTAGIIGAVSNTARLSLLDFTAMSPEGATLIAAMIASALAGYWKIITHRHLMHQGTSYPRVCLMVPSIVVMIPGLYLYQAMFHLGNVEVVPALEWGFRAMLIILMLPVGIATWRVISDKRWRYHV